MHQQVGGRQLGFSVRGNLNYSEFEYQENDWLLFGSETAGLPTNVLSDCHETLYIPMKEPNVRSLNLSVSVAISLFEARRKLGYMK